MPTPKTYPMRNTILNDKPIKAKGDILFKAFFVDFAKFSI
jgi:hypothetical protein